MSAMVTTAAWEPTDDENGAVTLAHICQQLVEHFALASPAQETWSTVGGHWP